MWLKSLAGFLILAGSTTGEAVEQPSAQSPSPQPIPTRQTTFSIPFHIDRAVQPEQEPIEVQLYVSTDRGVHWQLYGKTSPTEGHFLFRAGGDGEYWFLIRTLDRLGRLRPQGDNRPGLRVVVDTVAPELELEAERGPAGEIHARWKATDANLAPETLKVQYRAASNHPWQYVAVDHHKMAVSGPTRTGEVTWWSEAHAARIEIRAEVTDTAGNPAVTHAQVDFDRGPTGRRNDGPGQGQPTSPDFSHRPPQPASDWRGSVEASPPTAGHGSLPASLSGAGDPTPPDQTPGYHSATETTTADRYSGDRYRDPDTPTSDAGDFTAEPLEGSVAIQIHPAIRNQYVPLDGQAAAFAEAGLPPGETPRMVKTRAFELEYHVESIGPSGIGRVELWGTRDGGRTWSSFGCDDDKQSPMLVTVNEPGLYGFRVVVTSGAGLGGEEPQSGDAPDLWIGVDQAKPHARIVSTEQGTGDKAGQLIIRWEASDELLSDRPVSLLFSETAGGPWTPVASELENTGEYGWLVDGRLPERVYLRLEVRDEAGNLGIFETPEAVLLDQFRPVVHIRDVRPLSHTPKSPPKRYQIYGD